MNFSIRIKQLRDEHHLSQAQLAKIFNISPGTVGMWESDNRVPPAAFLSKLADYFNVSIDYLLGRDNINTDMPITDNTVIAIGHGGKREVYELNDKDAAFVRDFIENYIKKKSQ